MTRSVKEIHHPPFDMVVKGEKIIVRYKGKEIKDIPEAFEIITDQEHARLYMKCLRQLTPHADSNIGYCTGYYLTEKADELRKRFGVTHPFFGDEHQSPAKILATGVRLGRKMKKIAEKRAK